MGLKFKKFKAKLNWKTKVIEPQVVCLRYHVKSEFSEVRTKPPITDEEINNKNKETTMPTAYSLHNDTTQSEEHTSNNLTSDELIKSKNEKITTPLTQPRSILKKISVTNSPDLEEHKKSPLIFMTENHDEDNISQKHSNDVDHRIAHINNAVASFTNYETLSDSKTVNWRETIEFITAKGTETQSNGSRKQPRLKLESENESDEEYNGTHYENGIVYSTQAASIFFDSEELKSNERVKTTESIS
ncbi:hypothetical protein FQA39_LY15785 [Lamprigera yunnana]|nr:hypothetical protein FQA39_LY15785 [Lamprigera yunnana]